MPELHVLAGPNGSGKSTFTRQVFSGERKIDYTIPPVINPDVIAHAINAENPDAAILVAGRQALNERDLAIERRDSFSIETTLSGHSEIQLIRKAKAIDYTVTMTFVSVASAEDSAWRVTERAREERRTVPIDVVYRRFPRSLENLSKVVSLLDRIDVYDNSDKLLRIARLEHGRMIAIYNEVPAWAQGALDEPLEFWRDREAVTREAITRLSAQRTGVLAPKAREDELGRQSKVSGYVVSASEKHIAVVTARRSFIVLEQQILDRRIGVDEIITSTYAMAVAMSKRSKSAARNETTDALPRLSNYREVSAYYLLCSS